MSLFGRLRRRFAVARPADPAVGAPPSTDLLSPWGGFWTDTHDRLATLERLQREECVSAEEAGLLHHFMVQGYVVIPGVIDAATAQRAQAAIDRAIDTGEARMAHWEPQHKYEGPARRDKLAATECKVLDLHATLPEAQAISFAPKLRRFLELVMGGRKALAFQSLYFEYGSQQGVHQDTAFVHVEPALDFVASWVALEDITAGSGELFYFPGSHRLPDQLFGNPATKKLLSGDPACATYSARLDERCRAAGLKPERFLPRRGDALVWTADLAHGGSARTTERTRRSLVTHYCPVDRKPPFEGRRIEVVRGHCVVA